MATAQKITIDTTDSELLAAYRAGNNAGEGYSVASAPGGMDSDETPREAIERNQGLTFDREIGDDGACLATDIDGRLVVVADAHGPHAVAVDKAPKAAPPDALSAGRNDRRLASAEKVVEITSTELDAVLTLVDAGTVSPHSAIVDTARSAADRARGVLDTVLQQLGQHPGHAG